MEARRHYKKKKIFLEVVKQSIIGEMFYLQLSKQKGFFQSKTTIYFKDELCQD